MMNIKATIKCYFDCEGVTGTISRPLCIIGSLESQKAVIDNLYKELAEQSPSNISIDGSIEYLREGWICERSLFTPLEDFKKDTWDYYLNNLIDWFAIELKIIEQFHGIHVKCSPTPLMA